MIMILLDISNRGTGKFGKCYTIKKVYMLFCKSILNDMKPEQYHESHFI